MRPLLALTALAGLASVAFGAFGAHGIDDPKAQSWLRTGAEYGLAHALAVFAAAWIGGRWAGFAAGLFLAGVALFSGSLWAMALGAPPALGVVTPVGGLAFMAGWALLALAGLRKRQQP